ncbi:bromodomain-containing protein 8 [Lingula anatina]|uniref:Bromodomain-containing protein 8 n=1 Tax=Lingula anatina TaxID=7574 RepID=A0A1S3GY72_LINAN|nr:bromodomain-containing protein 8 [Lingula anatina]|eukprot:XP_013378703.1 bromodomain-containing protein 8 [Lingula anatina]
MAATPKFKVKHGALDVWSVKERLALASSVSRSGDQNWVSVSRSSKPFAEKLRPPDWFSTKNCALQYADLLENAETPKRKRGERGEIETPTVQIVRKLTIERIEELKRLIEEDQKKYRAMKQEYELVQSGQCDDKLREIWERIQKEKEAKAEAERVAVQKAEEEAASRAEALALAKMMRKIPKGGRASTSSISLEVDDSTQDSVSSEIEIGIEDSASTPTEGIISSSTPTPAATSQILSTLLTKGPAELQQFKEQTEQQNKQAQEAIKQQAQQQLQQQQQQLAAPPPVEGRPQVNIAAASATATRSNSSTDIPSSPSAGAPTLSKLLGTPFQKTAQQQQQQQQQLQQQQQKQTEESQVQVKREDSTESSECKADVVKEDEVPLAVVKKEKEESVEKQETPVDLPEPLPAPALDEQYVEPPSPASSVSSRVSEGGRSAKKTRGRGSSRPGSRRSTRVTRRSAQDDSKEEASIRLSEAESSDGETIQGSDDASVAPSRQAMSVSESFPNSPLSQCSDTEDERTYKAWKKAIMLVWRHAAQHKYANVFAHPVTDDIAPGYTSIVFRPLDLSTVKKNVESGIIRTTTEFQRDMMLMFTNAIMYNNSDHDVYQMAMEMYDDVMQHIEQFVSTQLMVQSSETKMLRGNRRSDTAASDKEEEQKRGSRRQSAEQEGGKTKRRKTRADD